VEELPSCEELFMREKGAGNRQDHSKMTLLPLSGHFVNLSKQTVMELIMNVIMISGSSSEHLESRTNIFI
jgi:hypothetical protein